MKKFISLILVVLMTFSVVSLGAASTSAVEVEYAFRAGDRIFFDNSYAQWDNIYMYAWNYGYYVDFIPMEKVNFDVENAKGNPIDNTNLYSLVIPQDVPDGASYFLFTNTTDWSGIQTFDQSATMGYNTYTPSADGKVVIRSYTEYPVFPEVAISPYSKNFTGTIDVTVHAFNLEEDQIATYKLNDEESVEFDESLIFTLEETTTVTVEIIDENESVITSTSCTFTKHDDAIITVKPVNDYDGPMYIYTYGGDRLVPSFDSMNYDADNEAYTYVLNGSAHVIFTTTNDWATAQKFLIFNEDGTLATDQEPFVNYGEIVIFYLILL